jgi:CheY-like chemotaxis protein
MDLEKRILIVDDDATVRALLSTVLRRRGFLTDAAHDGVEALEWLGRCRYALVLLDLAMPRMDGEEVLRRLATMPPPRRPVVLMLTERNVLKTFDTTMVAGIVHKPFDIDLLIDSVTGCLASLEGTEQLETCRKNSQKKNDAQDDAN